MAKTTKKTTNKYYTPLEINKRKALYNIIIGQRSNGKTFSLIKQGIIEYLKTGKYTAYIRRLDQMITPKMIKNLVNNPEMLKVIEQYSGGKYNHVRYISNCFNLQFYDDESKKVIYTDPHECIHTYAVNTWETSKGADNGRCKYIIFDEFLTRDFYLTNEFLSFTDIISSIIRDRDDTIIYMIGNTVNKYCPYFKEMGLYNIERQQQGTIEVYKYGNSGLTVAVEYCAENDVSKRVSKYFAFNNPRLEMKTKGVWELPVYPHMPKGIATYKEEYKFFIEFDNKYFEGNIYLYNDTPIICYQPKTTPIKDPQNTIIYSDTDLLSPLHCRNLCDGTTKVHKLIKAIHSQNKIFYSENETGEIINNWLKEQIKNRSIAIK